jgi:hypothetical protein
VTHYPVFRGSTKIHVAVVPYPLAILGQMTNDEAAVVPGMQAQRYDPMCRSLCVVRSRIRDRVARTFPKSNRELPWPRPMLRRSRRSVHRRPPPPSVVGDSQRSGAYHRPRYDLVLWIAPRSPDGAPPLPPSRYGMRPTARSPNIYPDQRKNPGSLISGEAGPQRASHLSKVRKSFCITSV